MLTQVSNKEITPINKNFELEQIKKAYHKMWKELKLPENLKPKLIFQESTDFKNMWFSLSEYTIFVNTKKEPLDLRLRNKTNKNKQILREEIEHVKQAWDVIRLHSGKELKDCLEYEESKAIIDSIETTLGPIKAGSREEKIAKLYSFGYKMYPDFNNIDEDSIYSVITPLLYYLNPLEICAHIASLEYRPNFISKTKRTIFEHVKDICRDIDKNF